jgi:hypothetical protein
MSWSLHLAGAYTNFDRMCESSERPCYDITLASDGGYLLHGGHEIGLAIGYRLFRSYNTYREQRLGVFYTYNYWTAAALSPFASLRLERGRIGGTSGYSYQSVAEGRLGINYFLSPAAAIGTYAFYRRYDHMTSQDGHGDSTGLGVSLSTFF